MSSPPSFSLLALVVVACASATPRQATALRLAPFASRVLEPGSGDGTPGSRGVVYVVEQGGLVRVVKAGKVQAAAVPRRAFPDPGRRRAGPPRARVRSELRHEPPVRDRLHRPERRHEGRPLPLERDEGAARQRHATALRRPAVLEPQRRQCGLRQGRAPLHRHGGRRLRRRPREPGSEPELAARQDPPPRLGPSPGRSP